MKWEGGAQREGLPGVYLSVGVLVCYVYVSFLVDGVKASIVEDTMSLFFLTFLLVLAPQRARLYTMIS